MKALEEEFNQNHSLSQENRKLRKLLDIYKQALSYGSQSISNDLFQCPNCPKAFGDVSFLQNHITRRHPEHGLEAKGLLPLSKRISQYSSALQMVTNSAGTFEEMKETIESIRDQLKETQNELKQEREARLALENKLSTQLEQRPKQLSTQLKIESYATKSSLDDNHSSKATGKDSGEKEDASKSLKEPDLTNLLLSHTKEVRNMGYRLEKLIEKLDVPKSDVLTRLSTQVEIKPFANQDEEKGRMVKKNLFEDKNQVYAPKATVVKDRKSLLNKLSSKLNNIGVKETNKVSYTAFHEALREVKAKRLQFRTYDRANHLRQFLDQQLRASNLTDFLPDKSISSDSLHYNQTDSVNYRPKLERTISEPSDFKNYLKADKKIDSEARSASISDSNIFDNPPKLKSLLIQRDSMGRRLSTDDGREKKLRFNDNRIEISPEVSDSQGEPESDLDDEVVRHQDESNVEEDEVEQLLDTHLEVDEKEKDGIENRQFNEPLKSSYISSLDERSSNNSTELTDSYLKASDLQWFDSDSDSDSDALQQTTTRVIKSEQANANTAKFSDQSTSLFDEKTVNVQELTRIIEEQLQTRATSKGPSNSVDAVTGQKQSASNKNKPVATLTIESDSD